ncbi:WAT1-related protein At5g64700 [Mercurialis annua]|uniref:WAT1-related protein At5g64700 n=1 Tax=Mercurialis annua TaxID=3986 RepID=UPI00215E04F9|nr:WAT1-related protein At5g64700 [Mercurialis annua]
MNEKKAYLAVFLVQSIYAGMFLISKAAFNGGLNNFVFVFYRQATATIFLGPVALFLERKNIPPMSFVTFCKLFLLSLFGVTLSLDIYGIGLVYTTATLAAATTNCLPVITFFLALLLRMEVLKLRTSAGKAKVIGIVACIGGVATLAFVKGPHFKQLCHYHIFGIHNTYQPHVSSGLTWVKGCFLMLMSNTFWGLWLVLQVGVLKSYPSKLLFTTFQCCLSSIQSFVIAIALVRHPHEWMLGWNVKLLAVLYCGILVTGVTFYIQSWIVEKKGPVFLAMSTPLNLVLTIFCSAVLLCETITLGSLLGGLLLVVGLYCVLWGKRKEEKINEKICMTNQVDKEFSELKQVTHLDVKDQLPV